MARLDALALLTLGFALLPLPLQAQGGETAKSEKPLATIVMYDGSISLIRDGKTLAPPEIGDPVYDDDYLATGPASSLTIDLLPPTGMRGSLVLKASTALYMRLDLLKGQAQNQIELISGQIGLKVKKLAGAPSFEVSSATMVCGVRGTEFEVSSANSGRLLVACSEGKVSCTSGLFSTSAQPGQVVEAGRGLFPARRAVEAQGIGTYTARWLEGEEKAFREGAARNGPGLILQYLATQARLEAISGQLAKDKELTAWAEERRKGLRPSAFEARRLRSAIRREGLKLAQARALFGRMERIEAQIQALGKVLDQGDTSLLMAQIKPGYTVGDFLKDFASMGHRDLERARGVRAAVKLHRDLANLLEAAPGTVP